MKKIQRLNGYFAYWTLMGFLIDDLGSQKDMETLEVEIMTGQRNNYFSTSHASHQYEPRSRKTKQNQACKT